MTLPFKYLPHEILNKPKPASAICVYPVAPHEFFIPKPTKKPVMPPKLVTTIHARLWSQNPQPTNHPKKKEKERPTSRPIDNVDPPAAETHRLALRRRWHHLHLQPPPLRTSTTTDAKTQDITPPLLYHSSRRCIPRLCATTTVNP